MVASWTEMFAEVLCEQVAMLPLCKLSLAKGKWMIDALLETWTCSANAISDSIVFPDGCRDLIGRWFHGKTPTWFVTSLDDCPRCVSLAKGDSLVGFRLKPGASIERLRFWLQLARVRRAAREVAASKSLVELAFDTGFSDRAHMTRQFRRWFAVTPLHFAANAEMQSLVHEPGYD